MNTKTLFKKDSKGKIRVWRIHTSGSSLIQESGLEDGKLVKHEKECIPKNVGRSNETTGAQQAKLEMESEIKSKYDEGYFDTKEQTETEEVILPMLAKSYGDHSKKIDWDTAYVQPKLDGMRALCHITENGITLVSRDGKIIQNMAHIIKDLSTTREDIILDGELYAYGFGFQDNMRLIKKYRPGKTEQIKYHVYDLVSGSSFIDRYTELSETIEGLKTVELVSTKKITHEKELKTAHAIYLNSGYEGSILRWGTKGYKVNGRSENLLKYKDFKDISLKIVDIIPSEQRPTWGQPIFELKGKTFSSGMKFSHSEREEFLKEKHKYLGMIAEVRFFEYSEEGIPRFPVMVGFRNDKNKQDDI